MIEVDGIRYDRHTHEPRIVTLTCEIREGYDKKPWLFIMSGSPTGFESISINGVKRCIEEEKGWAACFGTDDAWDRLEVPYESMQAIWNYYQRFGITTKEEKPRET